MTLLKEIQNKIEQKLPGANVKISDQSTNHQNHDAEGLHLAIEVVYKGFEEKTLVEQHQLIYKILQQEMKTKIHALQLKTRIK